MSPNAPRKPGRPPKYVKDENSHEIIGLSAQPVKDRFRYYATRSNPRVWFGFDFAEAVTRFRKWQSQQRDDRITVEATEPYPERAKAFLNQHFPEIEVADERTKTYAIPSDAFAEKLNEMLSTRKGRRKLAGLTGRKQFEYLDELDKPAYPLSLQKVGELADRAQEMGCEKKNDRQKSRMYWDEFCRVVKVTNVDEVTTDHLQDYRMFVADLRLKPRTVRNRYDRIGVILNSAFDMREQHQPVIDTLRKRFRVIVRKKRPKDTEPIPTPIVPEDFAACLDVADVKWKAVLLLMLNCGLHPGELTGLQFADVDQRKGWLWDHRNKTKKQRCSPLWAETVEALKAYLKEYKPSGRYIFVNQADKRNPTGEFGNEFKAKVRDPAGVKSVTLEWFRDGGTDAASRRHVDGDKIRMWLGHPRIGELDKYDPRHPTKTQPVVDAIYAEYFG